MAKYSAARFEHTDNFTAGRNGERPRFIVLHIQEGSQGGSIDWFKNPASQASAHFLISKTGDVVQMVDTNDTAWSQIGGNHVGISIEFEGHAPEKLTAKQMTSAVSLVAWLAETHKMVLRTCTSAKDAVGGVIGHGEGVKTGWGGDHYGCPGTGVLSGRPFLVASAVALIQRGHSKRSVSVPPQSKPASPAPAPVGASTANTDLPETLTLADSSGKILGTFLRKDA